MGPVVRDATGFGGCKTAVGPEVPGPDNTDDGEGVGISTVTLGFVVGTLLVCVFEGNDITTLGPEVAGSETVGDGSGVGIPGETFGLTVVPTGGVRSLGTPLVSSLGALVGFGVVDPDTTVGTGVVAPGTTIIVGFVFVAETLGSLLLTSFGALLGACVFGRDTAVGPEVFGPEVVADGSGVRTVAVMLGIELSLTGDLESFGASLGTLLGDSAACVGRGVGLGTAEDGPAVGFPGLLLGLELVAAIGPAVAGPETACDGKGVGLFSAILGPKLVPPVPVASLGALLSLPLGTSLSRRRLGELLVEPAVGM